MKFIKVKPKLGEVISVSDSMSLRYEKLAEDLSPVWMEAPPAESSGKYPEGSYIMVTNDLWFLYDHNSWRVMIMNERIEANRQSYFNDLMP